MKPGDLVMPNDIFLRMIHPYPSNVKPGVLVKRILTARPQSLSSHSSWQVLWRDERHVMFENEFTLVEGSNV